MLSTNFLSVAQFQLKLHIKCDNLKDTLIIDDDYYNQINKSIDVIKKLKPDICIFPEMSFTKDYDDVFRALSKDGKLIVFGSTYIESTNKTMIYSNGILNEVIKRYPCGSEPMVRFSEKITTDEFISNYLKEHEFTVYGNKVYVLNCLEYYQAAYMIARDETLSKDLFAFIVPCSNSNPNVFIEETKAIHNHNENIYSFVCNRIKDDKTGRYGRSYVYGPIQQHEKEWLALDGINSDSHNSSILILDNKTPSYTYGQYATFNNISRFGRSDFYINTPKQVKVEKLLY